MKYRQASPVIGEMSVRMAELVFAALVALLFATSVAVAVPLHDKPAAGPTVDAMLGEAIGRAERTIGELSKQVDAARAKLQSPTTSNAELDAIRQQLEKVRLSTLNEQNLLTPRLNDLRQQLKLLGDAPPEGQSEPQDVAVQRQRLNDTISKLEGLGKQIDLVAVDAEQVSSRAAQRQRSAFVREIFKSSRSALNPLVWVDLAKNFPQLTSRVATFISNWDSSPGVNAFITGRVSLILVSCTIFLCLAFLSLFLSKLGPKLWKVGAPGNLSRQVRAVTQLIGVLIITIALWLLVYALVGSNPEVYPRATAVLRDGILPAFFAIGSMSALQYALLAPGAPEWRLVRVSDPYAGLAVLFGIVAASVYSIDTLVAVFSDVLFMPVEFTIGWHATTTLVMLVAFALMLTNLRLGGDAFDEVGEEEPGRNYYFGWLRRLYPLFWGVMLVSILAMLMGYIAFAHFLVGQVLSSGTIILWLFIFHRFADMIVIRALEPWSQVGRFLRRTVSLSDKAISRLGLFASTFVDIAVVLIGVPLVASQWALTWVDFRSAIVTAFFGFKVGDIVISPSSILLGVSVLIGGLVAARMFTAWLDQRVLARSQMDSGVRNSISTGAHYAAFMVAGGIALTSAGLDFSNLAFVFGALGVGIGFGLQSIVNNFVSGLILLAERPIKVGDWIKVSGGEGIVKRINVRSTEIETFDRCSVFVPNSSLISESVSNWYHNNMMGRVSIAVGVSYDSDPEQVKEILLECGRKHQHALRHPEPFVLFMGFGESSLDFELRVYIDDVGWVAIVGSDLRFSIFKALREAGIEIPFPQRDLNLRDLDRLERAMAGRVPSATTEGQ